ncbi:hypothetical protein V1505DRAFT_288463, partial [Lipomyces doorenjongii]
FTEVESEYFQTIFKGIPGVNPLFKSASTATSLLLELYIAQKSELRCELATTAISVSISIDGWTSPTRCAAIVAHWITGEWEAREAVLHIAELPGSHTGVALAQEVLTCLRFYDIKKKLVAITSDNASNNAALVHKLERLLMPRQRSVEKPAMVPNKILFRGQASWVRCLAHSLNLVVKEVLNGL